MADETWNGTPPVESFLSLAERYQKERRFGAALLNGARVTANRCEYYPWHRARQRSLDLARMVQESLRWGEPNIALDSDGLYVWCVPLCLNNQAVGGIFSAVHPGRAREESGPLIGQAAWSLLELSCAANLCNESLMRQNRTQARASATKAEAIHSVKHNLYQNPREVYLQEEFALLAAIRKGDKERARSIINRILIRIYAQGGEDLDVLKALVLEMVVLMYRTAVDKGADPRELLGVNSSYLKEFNDLKDYAELSHWLTGWLEDFISSSLVRVTPAPPDSIALALEFMKNNLAEPLTRDEVARACNMSYGYFSKIFHQKTGYTFTDLLNKFRIEKACTLIDETGLNINQVALESGFADQSYFSKVFRRYHGVSPLAYRRRKAAQ